MSPDSKRDRTLVIDDHTPSLSEHSALSRDINLASPLSCGDSSTTHSSSVSTDPGSWILPQYIQSSTEPTSLLQQLEHCKRQIEKLTSQLSKTQEENQELKRQLAEMKAPPHPAYGKTKPFEKSEVSYRLSEDTYNFNSYDFAPFGTPIKHDTGNTLPLMATPDTSDPSWLVFFSYNMQSRHSPLLTPGHELPDEVSSTDPDLVINQMFGSFTFDDS